MTIITPTTGRVVLFLAGPQDLADGSLTCLSVTTPMPALVAFVNPDGTVNLAGFDHAGKPFSRVGVTLIQPGDTPPTEEVTSDEDVVYLAQSRHCRWMDYQVQQAQAAAATPTPTPTATPAPAPVSTTTTNA